VLLRPSWATRVSNTLKSYISLQDDLPSWLYQYTVYTSRDIYPTTLLNNTYASVDHVLHNQTFALLDTGCNQQVISTRRPPKLIFKTFFVYHKLTLWKQPKISFPPIWDMVFPKWHHLSRIKLCTKDYQQLQNTTDVVKEQWLMCANRWQHFTNLHKDCKIYKKNTNEPKDIWLNNLAQTLRKRNFLSLHISESYFDKTKYWQA